MTRTIEFKARTEFIIDENAPLDTCLDAPAPRNSRVILPSHPDYKPDYRCSGCNYDLNIYLARKPNPLVCPGCESELFPR